MTVPDLTTPDLPDLPDPVEDRLRGYLQDRADLVPASPLLGPTLTRVRRRRHRLAAAGAGALVALTIIASTALALTGNAFRTAQVTSPSPTSPSPTGPALRYHGIAIALTGGWHRTKYEFCGPPAEHSVSVIDLSQGVPMCAARQPDPRVTSSLVLSDLWGSSGFGSSTGTATTWDGQPAELTGPDSGTGIGGARGSTWTLTLPWLNVAVTSTAPDAATARAALDRVRVEAVTRDWSVPTSAARLTVLSLSDQDGARRAAFTDRRRIAEVLEALGALHRIPRSGRPCSTGPWGRTELLTFDTAAGEVTVAVRQDGCPEVLNGSGIAGALTPAVTARLAALLPPSAFTAG